jgi:serine/threonine-protein kinase
MGEVYRALAVDGRPVAIKRLRPHLVYDRREVEKFLQEGKILRKLHHPAFPKLIEACAQREEAYLVMDWVEGEPFEEYFRKFANTEARERHGARFAFSLLQALKYLQELTPPDGGRAGLVHADLKPKNILIGSEGSAKVLDFSHAVWLEEGGGSVGGTWGYMHLKQMVEKKVNFNTDLFAAGLLMAEALAGERLLEGKSKLQIFFSADDLNAGAAAAKVSSNPILRQVLEALFESVKGDEANPTGNILSQLRAYLSVNGDTF